MQEVAASCIPFLIDEMKLLVFIFTFLFTFAALAENVYQQPEEFIKETFEGLPPEPETFWIDKEIRPKVNEIMGHKYPVFRTKYWRRGGRTVWILEEIGKVKPITTGIVVSGGEVERLKVLIYRESHGWEVRHDFFTDQFKQAALEDGYRLTKTVNNISGATMSVDALINLSKLALFLNKQVMDNGT